MPESIKEILMRRDGLSEDEAQERVKEAKEQIQECVAEGDFGYEDAVDFMKDEFGLEPDYLDELIF